MQVVRYLHYHAGLVLQIGVIDDGYSIRAGLDEPLHGKGYVAFGAYLAFDVGPDLGIDQCLFGIAAEWGGAGIADDQPTDRSLQQILQVLQLYWTVIECCNHQ